MTPIDKCQLNLALNPHQIFMVGSLALSGIIVRLLLDFFKPLSDHELRTQNSFRPNRCNHKIQTSSPACLENSRNSAYFATAGAYTGFVGEARGPQGLVPRHSVDGIACPFRPIVF